MDKRCTSVVGALAISLACGTTSEDPSAEGTGESGTETSTTVAADGDSTGESTDDSATGDTADESGDDESSGGAACGTVAPTDTIAVTRDGPFQGATRGDTVAFLGIPFAQPPTGPLRWAPPAATTCDPEVRTATELGPLCPQLLGASEPVVGDEDCLQLNVWTPAVDDGARPVMVFIHGGGNAIGSATNAIYDGAHLAATQDVVVVTINYRLGALGFLTHPDLAAESKEGVSGNYGILDQIAALEWVEANVDAFGGDPARVTAFGESAGAVNVCALVGSPLAEGLFDAAIVQSGTCFQRALSMYETQMSTPFASASGCEDDADPIACLRALPASTVVETPPTGYPSEITGQGWGPHVDGWVLPESTLSSMESGTHNDVPLIVGSNAEEEANSAPATLTLEEYEALIDLTFGALAPLVLAQYPASDYASPRDAYIALTTDLRFTCGARRALVAAADQRSPLYRYSFAYNDYNAIGLVPNAAFHGLELVYIFGNFDTLLPAPLEYEPNPGDLAMAAAMGRAWSDFARGQTPTLDDDATTPWPSYDAATDPYALLDVPPGTGAGVQTAQCDFWDTLAGG